MDLFKKLDQVVENNQDPNAIRSGAPASDPRPRGAPRARLEEGRRAADYVAERFERFMASRIAPRYPGLFDARVLAARDAFDTPAFGHLNPAAEHAVCQVVFKETHELFLRFSAIIMSGEFETELGFKKTRRGSPPERSMVRLTDHVTDGRVRWESVFEAALQQFIDWYGDGS